MGWKRGLLLGCGIKNKTLTNVKVSFNIKTRLYSGITTESITWITPLDPATSVAIIWLMLPWVSFK
mgnify:CR=1 FL=1